MRILYGLSGEGMGHATRSKVSIRHLRRLGHDILVVVPGPKAYSVLQEAHPNVLEITGLSMRCCDGAMDLGGTLDENLQKLPGVFTRDADVWQRVEAFDPEAVVTDHEPFSWLFAQSHGLSVVSIDNAQIITRCTHEDAVLEPYADGFRVLASFERAIAPYCDHYLITSFFYPTIRPYFERTTTLVPPILREEVLALLATDSPPEGDHVLLYKTPSLDDATMLRAAAEVPARFFVYGVSPSAPMPSNCVYRPFDEVVFLRELATCRAIISNGGMSLTGEAVAFGKPVYAVPVRAQYEQVLNARYLERLGYGATSDYFDPRLLTAFLEKLPLYKKQMKSVPQHDGNRRLYATLSALFGSV